MGAGKCKISPGVENTSGLSALLQGMSIQEEIIRRLKGIRCQGDTSCPDQLVRALEAMQTPGVDAVSKE